jgi:pentatricopeptide repeat protein
MRKLPIPVIPSVMANTNSSTSSTSYLSRKPPVVTVSESKGGQSLKTAPFIKPTTQATPKPDDPYLHSIRIKQMALKGDLERALSYFDTKLAQKRIPYNTAVFNTVIDVLGHSGRFRQAQRVYDEMRRRAVSPDHYTFSSLLMALSKNEDAELKREAAADLAVKYYELACGFGCGSTSVFNNMLAVMAQVVGSEKLVKVFPVDMTEPSPDKITFAIMLRQLQSSFDRWFPYYERLIKDSIPIDAALMTVILGCVRTAQEQSLDSAHSARLTTDILPIITKKIQATQYQRATIPAHSLYLHVLRKARLFTQAVSHYDHVIKPALDSRNIDSVIVDSALRSMNQSGRYERVLSEFERLRQHAHYRPSPRDMSSIVEACVGMGRIKCAVSYLEGYVVNGHVAPDARLMGKLSQSASMRAFYEDVFRPFVERVHPAVSLEFTNYLMLSRNGTKFTTSHPYSQSRPHHHHHLEHRQSHQNRHSDRHLKRSASRGES